MALTRNELLHFIDTRAGGDWKNIESIVADNNGVFSFRQYIGVPGNGINFIDEPIPGATDEYLTGFVFYYLPSAPYRKTDYGAVRSESIEWFVNVSDIMGISTIPNPIPSYVTPAGGFITPPVEVTATLSGATTDGFTVTLSEKVDDLGVPNFTIKYGTTVANIDSVSTSDGKVYEISAPITKGYDYEVIISKRGFDFGDPLDLNIVADAITFTIQSVHPRGFNISFSEDIPMPAHRITIMDGTREITATSTTKIGQWYNVTAYLKEGRTYTVSIASPGYTFGSAQNITVPYITQGVYTVDGQNEEEFFINFDVDVDTLTSSELRLTSAGAFVPITSITKVNNRRYRVVANLQVNRSYYVIINKLNYVMSARAVFYVTPPPVVSTTISNITLEEFDVILSSAVPELVVSDITLTDGTNPVTVTGVTEVNNGLRYTITADLEPGQDYEISIEKTGFIFGDVATFTTPTLTVAKTVSNITIGSFRVNLTPAVDNLVAADFTLLRGTTPVSITNVAAVNGGQYYTVTAALQYDQAYKSNIEKAGLEFGNPVSFNAPATTTVTATIANITPTGFRINMSPTVAGMTAGHLTLTQGGTNVPITSVTAVGGGASYDVVATLQRGVTYSLALARTGYNFGSAKSIPVPIENVTLGVNTVNISNFTVTLNAAVPGLVAGDFTLLRGATPVTITNATTSNGGASYVLTAALQYDQSYTVTAAKSGYNFGTATPFNAPVTTTVSKAVSAITTTNFVVTLTPAVPSLVTADFALLQGATPVTITNAVTSNGGSTYTITAAIAYDTAYTINATKAGYNFGAASSFNGPATVNVTKTVTGVTTTNFVVNMAPAAPGLTAANFTLLQGGSAVTITNATTANSGASYTITATIAHGLPYTINASRAGFNFGSATAFNGPAIVAVTGTVDEATTTGINITFSPAVNGLTTGNFAVTNNGSPFTITSVTSLGGGSYSLDATFVAGEDYEITVTTTGYTFNNPLTASVPV